jgi:citrate lyase subunit beta/citryl-CoA lyase
MDAMRSLLNTPANRPAMVDKAAGYGADALILDLEDSVPVAEKGEARLIAREALGRSGADGVVRYVRVNAAATGLLEADLDAIVVAGLRGIQLPKVDGPQEILDVDGRLTELERARGLAAGAIELLVSLESARGVFYAHEILGAAPRVGSVMLGTAEDGDLQGDLGYLTTGDDRELAYLRSKVLLAARVVGLTNPIDGVYARVRDLAGLEATARRARELGFRGKKLIHPAQIEIAHRVFSPTPAELDRARRVIETFDTALADRRASAEVDGRMIDYAMVETARRLLAREIRPASAGAASAHDPAHPPLPPSGDRP